ncbi:MAG TPA: NAD(P)-dependent oxidoreductase [Candidatus Acidoferrales bacterium]|nr:NAD(P)-dependent oxidoreductase [Candidatus Acidoferrales bacterium]
MTFKLGLTADFLNAKGEIGWGDIGLAMLDQSPAISWEFLADCGSELPPEVADDYDALLVLTPRVTAGTVARPKKRLRLVARFGVGYDNVDVGACTKAGVALTITPDGVRRPVAVGAIALILAATHNVVVKDRLTREGRWAQKLAYMGTGITGKTLGIVGLGNTGRELVVASQSLGMTYQAYDPYADEGAAASLGVPLIDLPTLMQTSDVVCIMAALTEETRHLIGARELAAMKGSAYLVNIGRGGIVDEAALIAALSEGRIRGAALDVFEEEPPDPGNPLLRMENVVLAPHAICWTDEIALGNGRSALQAVVDVAAGRRPSNVVNPEVFAQMDASARLR